jgi:hypothetical protein
MKSHKITQQPQKPDKKLAQIWTPKKCFVVVFDQINK